MAASNRIIKIEYDDYKDIRYVYYNYDDVEVEFKKSNEYPFVIFRRDKMTDHIEYVDAWGDRDNADDEVITYNDKNLSYEYYVEDYSDQPEGWYVVDSEGWY